MIRLTILIRKRIGRRRSFIESWVAVSSEITSTFCKSVVMVSGSMVGNFLRPSTPSLQFRSPIVAAPSINTVTNISMRSIWTLHLVIVFLWVVSDMLWFWWIARLGIIGYSACNLSRPRRSYLRFGNFELRPGVSHHAFTATATQSFSVRR